MHLKRFLFAGVALIFLAHARHAIATTVTTTSYSVWKNGLTGNPIELDFTKVKNVSYNTATGITLLPLQGPALPFLITGPDKTGYSLVGGFYGSTVSLFGASDGTGYIRVDLPSGGENAILLSLATQPSASLTVMLSDQQIFTVSNGLFGLLLSHDITWLTISTVNHSQPVLDDFFFGNSTLAQDQINQSGSAEAAPALMIGGGLLILFGARRRFKGRAAAQG
ncbi:MAG TPA: hypothetical protein VH601_24735 [Bryobacteraceae bacterium]